MRAAHASAQGNDVHEKAAQRRLRADIAAFLRARGECRDGTGALTGTKRVLTDARDSDSYNTQPHPAGGDSADGPALSSINPKLVEAVEDEEPADFSLVDLDRSLPVEESPLVLKTKRMGLFAPSLDVDGASLKLVSAAAKRRTGKLAGGV
ncbi:hypothetical protein C8Q76DRAFT_697494 [Earliella scabrosa]|nr:hypothetical protein C8Q76DRAFT_697494 [Earliella scabrosa]